MNPFEPLKEPEHITGFAKDPACHPTPSPETLRQAGFKPVDVICWTNQKGQVVFQNGEEFYKPPQIKDRCTTTMNGQHIYLLDHCFRGIHQPRQPWKCE